MRDVKTEMTSFQIGRGAHILKVVHVDDVNDWRNYPRLILKHRRKNIYFPSTAAKQWQEICRIGKYLSEIKGPHDEESSSKYFHSKYWFVRLCFEFTFCLSFRAGKLCSFVIPSRASVQWDSAGLKRIQTKHWTHGPKTQKQTSRY